MKAQPLILNIHCAAEREMKKNNESLLFIYFIQFIFVEWGYTPFEQLRRMLLKPSSFAEQVTYVSHSDQNCLWMNLLAPENHQNPDAHLFIIPRHLCRGVYSFRISVRTFVRSCVHHVLGIYDKVFYRVA